MRRLGVPHRIAAGMVVALAVLVSSAAVGANAGRRAETGKRHVDPAIATVYPAAHPRGIMATSGGWAYCQQVIATARKTGYTLICGRYYLDGYLGLGLRSKRQEDWGNPAYLASFADKIENLHARVGGPLILIGVSYSGFGVATLATHHPELRPSRLIVIDSFLDLVARYHDISPTHPTKREMDEETGGSDAVLRERSASAEGLARLVHQGTRLTFIWSVSPAEKRYTGGATCSADSSPDTLAKLADLLGRPVDAWVSMNEHAHDLWDHGVAIIDKNRNPGRHIVFQPGGGIPAGATC